MSEFSMIQKQHVESLYSQKVIRACADPHPVEPFQCEVCGANVAQPVFLLPGTTYRIVHCTECGLGTLYPPPTLSEISAFYPSPYYGSGGKKFSGLVEAVVRMVGARLSRFLVKQIPSQGRVLDVGCGRGVTLKTLANAGLEAHGFEVNRDAIKGLDSRIQAKIAPSLVEANYDAEYFDAIIIWHVLEHVSEPRKTLAEACRILRPGGVLVVAVPNASSWQAKITGPAWFHLDPPRHLFHFPLPALKQLLTSVGFQCQRTHHFSLRQNPFGWIQSILNFIPWLPRNGLYSLLHRHGERSGFAMPFSRGMRIQMYALFVLLAPPALMLSVAAALFRRGATVHVVCRREPNADEE
ncbi:Ubiquinone biosynthesis O-methyltransferase [Gimesia alba]|uniref:Ubiquinone biosynthesis O-methyltransferase n=1 Tax=Gimesia alba TaxID=2527973 RepID=A0A517R816_9PLAN|nr:class I SAM-dependent methyltransferase [Gimesia alba]QDT40002.1 Ubiquinone biosynthesis O-methyltransferase [Gimesia alba]